MARFAALLLVAGPVAACANTGTSSTTSEADPATTTVPAVATTVAEVTTTQASPTATVASTTTDTTGVFADMPEVCVEAIQTYFIAIQEPLAAYDFETSGWPQFQQLQMAMLPAQEPLAEAMEDPACAEAAGVLNPQNYAALLAWGETTAPGVVTYLEISRALTDLSFGESCETSMSDLQAYVDRGGTVADVSVTERWHAFNLVAFIGNWCGLEVGVRFISQDPIEEFIGATLVG